MVASALYPEERLQRLEALLGTRFGVTLSRYADGLVQQMLAWLPAEPRSPDEATLRRLITACCIGETMFLRHPEQFAALRELLPALQAEVPGRPLRLWSAGCATGEEAWSLAAVTRGHLGPPVEVLGTDLQPDFIAQARRGRYRLWSLRGVHPRDVVGWCRVEGSEVEVLPELHPRVGFAQHNLMESPPPGPFDVVFCRNVLLYFRGDHACDALERLASSVRPGGYLFLGPCDAAPAAGGAWRAHGVGGVDCFRRVGTLEEVGGTLTFEAGRPLAPARRASSLGPEERALGGVELETLLESARGLCGRGEYAEALRLLDEAAHAWPLAVEVYVLGALVADEAGLPARALDSARRGCCLAPELAVTQYLLGMALARVGEPRRAQERLRRARELLDALPDPSGALPHGEGLTGSQLQRMLDVHLTPR